MDGSVALFETEKIFSNFFVPIADFKSNAPVRSLAFGGSGRFMAIGGDNGLVSVLSAKGGWVVCNQINFGCAILSTKCSPAGRYVGVAGSGKNFRIYDTTTWEIIKDFKESQPKIFTNQVDTISCLDWSLDSKWVAIGGAGSGIHLLNTSDWILMGPSTDGLTLTTSSSEG